MNNLLKNKLKKFNSKKGFTLVELIVAVMILMIVISASVQGLNISYRSTLMGAAKNDAQSMAERNCDIIMSAIVTTVENTPYSSSEVDDLKGLLNSTSPGPVGLSASSGMLNDIGNDTYIYLSGGYNSAQYAPIQQVVGNASAVESKRASETDDKKFQYFTIDKSERDMTNAAGTVTKTYQIYRITTYVYYSDKGYVTCEGEVSVLPEP